MYNAGLCGSSAIPLCLTVGLNSYHCHTYPGVPYHQKSIIKPTFSSRIHIKTWLQSYRLQVVQVGTNTSTILTPHTGVPQGCVIRPLLYALSINRLYQPLTSASFPRFSNCGAITSLPAFFELLQQRQRVYTFGAMTSFSMLIWKKNKRNNC